MGTSESDLKDRLTYMQYQHIYSAKDKNLFTETCVANGEVIYDDAGVARLNRTAVH